MKLSLSWIYDHIIAQNKHVDVDIADLVTLFNEKVAEIESYNVLSLDINHMTLCNVLSLDNGVITLYSSERDCTYTLPQRKDIVHKNDHYMYLINDADKDKPRWVTLIDLGSDKDGYVGALYCNEEDIDGAWKEKCAPHDYVIDISNTSITNRPDLWSHRGIAREICMLYGQKLLDEKDMLYDVDVYTYTALESENTNKNAYNISIKNTDMCDQLAGITVTDLTYKPSDIYMTFKLCRVDSKPISCIVDATNYVMLDIGQPMHAFDARHITGDTIYARSADDNETLTLLDGDEVELSRNMCVISDKDKPLALAGVMGGLDSSVTNKTTSLFLEAGHFNPSRTRITASYVKKRTDASVRFEKNLDPHANIKALKRFLYILDHCDVSFDIQGSLLSVGFPIESLVIDITRHFVSQKLGIDVHHDDMMKLELLGFVCTQDEYDSSLYHILVPSYRATKDITIKEDIVEEVARLIGFDRIPFSLPTRLMKPFSTHRVQAVKALKNCCAFALGMQEVQGYSFFDESFLKDISYNPDSCVTIQNPVSENYQRLVSSLIPHVCKDIITNKSNHDELNFFEYGRIFCQVSDRDVSETYRCSGIFYKKHHKVNFYDCQALVERICDLFGLSVEYRKVTDQLDPWFHPYKTAHIIHHGTVIGTIGSVRPEFFDQSKIEGDAFIFDIDADYICSYHKPVHTFTPLAKYQSTTQDISIRVSCDTTVKYITDSITDADNRIIDAYIVDSYYDESWDNQKSLTIRYIAQDQHKTLTKDDIEDIYHNVTDALKREEVIIR
jgi:phenylalanyl-tRNA synthetase beta chain